MSGPGDDDPRFAPPVAGVDDDPRFAPPVAGVDDDPRFAPPAAGVDDAAELELAAAPVPPRAAPRVRRARAADVAGEPGPGRVPQVARGTLALLLAPPAVLLPARWRARLGLDALPLRGGALVIGFLQVVLAIGGFLWLIQDVHARLLAPHSADLVDYIADSQSPHAVGGVRATGMALWIYVLLSWQGAGCVYLLGEALLRMAAVPSSGEIIPSGPLALLDRAYVAWRRYLEARRLPPLVEDEVTRSAGGAWLEIASCRVRDWPIGTVLIVEAFAWRVAGMVERAGAPRPFVYRLEPAPEGQVTRGRPLYRPDALTRPAPR